MNNMNKLYTYTNTHKSLKLLEIYIGKILNPLSKKLKFIPNFDLLSQDLLFTSIKYVGIKDYIYEKLDSKELSYYLKINEGVSNFSKQNKTIKTKKNLISYLINNLSNGNYYYTMDEKVFIGNIMVDVTWLVDISNFLINSINLSDMISEDRYQFIYRFLEYNNNNYYIYDYSVKKTKKQKISYHEQLFLYDTLKNINNYDFKETKELNSLLNREGYILSINKQSLVHTKANKDYINNLPIDKLENYLNDFFKTSNRRSLKNRIKMTETYELFRSISHAYKEEYKPEKCRNLFTIDNKEEAYLGYIFSHYFLNYLYDYKSLQKGYHYNELNTEYIKVSIIDYRSNNYLGTLKKLSKISKKIIKQNNVINKQMLKNYTNLESLKDNAKSLSSSCNKLYSLVKTKKTLEAKLTIYDEYNKGNKEYLIKYLTNSIFSYNYTFSKGIIHLSINNYTYNDTIFKLDTGITNIINFINDEDNLLHRMKFYQEGDDSNE